MLEGGYYERKENVGIRIGYSAGGSDGNITNEFDDLLEKGFGKENRAEWHINEDQLGKIKIYAKSEVPEEICGSGTILGLVLLLLLFRKRRWRL